MASKTKHGAETFQKRPEQDQKKKADLNWKIKALDNQFRPKDKTRSQPELGLQAWPEWLKAGCLYEWWTGPVWPPDWATKLMTSPRERARVRDCLPVGSGNKRVKPITFLDWSQFILYLFFSLFLIFFWWGCFLFFFLRNFFLIWPNYVF